MRTAQVSELKDRLDEVIEAVRNGETVEIREGISPIAQVVPETLNVASPQSTSDKSAPEERLDVLVRQGKARRGTATLADDFFTRPLPTARESVLEALLEDRRSD